MLSKSLVGAGRYVLLSCLVAQATAQTYTSCNPLSQTCDAAPALAGSLDTDFTQGSSSRYEAYLSSERVTYGTANGAEFTISQRGDTPTVESDFYIMFGRVEFVAQAAPGTGIISSMVLISDDLDEIDIEWVGGDEYHVQSNYFSKGDTSTYDRGQYHDLYHPQTTMFSYAIDWTSDRIIWYVNGQAVRTLENPGTGYYPQTPMQVRFGSWAGGDSSNSEGTIEWAGGATDYSAGPFNFYVKSINVQDYSTGTEYKYTDHSGSWTSIEAVDGQVNGNLDGSNDQSAGQTINSGVSSISSSAVVASSSSEVSSSSSSSTSTTSTTSTSSSSTSSSSSSSSSSPIYYVPSFTYVASEAPESSASSIAPPITTLVTETDTGSDTSFIITTSWDVASAEKSGSSMTFEFSEGAVDDTLAAESGLTPNVALHVAVAQNTSSNTSSNSQPEQANDSASNTLSSLLVAGSIILAYIVVF